MKNQLSKEDKHNLSNKLLNIFSKIINNNIQSYRPLYYETRQNKNIYSEYHNLIKENIDNSNNITYILYIISKEIFFTELNQDKIKLFNLLPEFYSPFLNNINTNLNISQTYPYLSRILTVIQNNLLLNIQPKAISEIFGKIILILFNNEYENKKLKKIYEICQGFCFYNMKQNEYKNQICGVLCLKEIIINTNYYMDNNKFIKNIYEKIILFIDNNNFEPKEYLVELLGIFITRTQQYYKPYINITFYKLLNYIETNNIILKQKILDVLGIIITIFPYEFISINESLINFLVLLLKEDNEYIKNKSNKILNELKNIYNLKTNSTNALNDKRYSTFSSFRKYSPIFNKPMRNSYLNNIRNDSTFSKSTRYTSSKKYIKGNNNVLNDYKRDIIVNNNNKSDSNKNRGKYSAKTLNINIYRNHYKKMKEKSSNNNLKMGPKTIDENHKSLMFNLNRLKNDINNMSSSLNNHVNQIENKIYLKK